MEYAARCAASGTTPSSQSRSYDHQVSLVSQSVAVCNCAETCNRDNTSSPANPGGDASKSAHSRLSGFSTAAVSSERDRAIGLLFASD
jgi:hypothetical protein